LLQINPSWFRVDTWLIVAVIIAFVAFIAVAVYWGIRAHQQQASAGREELIGKAAEIMVALEPKGVIFVEGERWTAILDRGRGEPGEEVLITKVDGLKLLVTKKQ